MQKPPSLASTGAGAIAADTTIITIHFIPITAPDAILNIWEHSRIEVYRWIPIAVPIGTSGCAGVDIGVDMDTSVRVVGMWLILIKVLVIRSLLDWDR